MSVLVSHGHLSVFHGTCRSFFPLQALKSLIGSSLPPVTEPVLALRLHLSSPRMNTTFPSQLRRDNHVAHSSPILPSDCSRVLELYTSVFPQYTSLPSSKNLPLSISSFLHVPGNRLTSHWSVLRPPGMFNPSVRCHLSLNRTAEHDHFSMPENS